MYLKKRRAAIKFQKAYRAHLARVRFQVKREAEINRRNVEYFAAQATVIQRYFRGFHKRKYIHDFYARKQFLDNQMKNDKRFLDELYKRSEEEHIEEERRREAVARQEFSELAKNLHHLSSTHQIPGVYNPPYATQKPTAFNIDVETHLKATFKASYKWTPPKKLDILKHSLRAPVSDLHATDAPAPVRKLLRPITHQPKSSTQN